MQMSAAQIAREWGVQPITITRLRRRGLIPYTRISPKLVRYDPELVREALQRLSAAHSAAVPASPLTGQASATDTAPGASPVLKVNKLEGHSHDC